MGSLVTGLSKSDDRSYGDRELIHRIARCFRGEWRRVLFVVAMTLCGSLATAAQPLLVRRSIDIAAAEWRPQTAGMLAIAIVASGLVTWTVGYLRQKASTRAVQDVVLRLRVDGMAAVLAHDMSFHDDNTTGRTVSRITSDTWEPAGAARLVMDLASQVLLLAILLVALLTIYWRLALLAVVISIGVVLVALLLRKVSRPAAQQEMRMRATVQATVGESIAGLAVAKSFRQEKTLYDQFLQVSDLAYRAELRRGLVLESVFPALYALRAIATTAIAFAGGMGAIQGEISPGTWYLFFQALALFMDPLIGIAGFWGHFQGGLVAAERVFALIDAEPGVAQVASEPVPHLQGKIAFRDVSFAYTPGEDVLKGFSLTIPPGETLAFVGHTGAGKSSLARLIARFYEFQDGQLLVDDKDIRSFDLTQYRRQVGLVPQSPFLFSGSLLDNIRYGVPNATEEQVLAAARRIGHGDWLDDLPHGLHTDVGERGASLSMGQRQLVALARVLIHDPAILVLDEATASVDPFTEAQIQEGLEEVFRDRTSIIIAHRLSTVKNADRIVVLEEGAIIEEGTHDGLLAQGGHYADLYNTYFRHQELDYRPPIDVKEA
jgi:ATP-binding cassette subfamily B protein